MRNVSRHIVRRRGSLLIATLIGAAALIAANAAATTAEARPAHCPPGLADKGCVPPGQAKKWAEGQVLPADARYVLVKRTAAAPPGTVFVRVDDEMLLINEISRRIVWVLTNE